LATYWPARLLCKKDAERVDTATPSLTPNNVYHYIIEKFKESVKELSFAERLVFYHEYIICLNPDDYSLFMENKKGIFGIIVHESLKEIYGMLKEYRSLGKTVVPSASRWIFRFVSHPEYMQGDISFIGKLLPDNAQATQTSENLRVTYIPRQTGIAQTFDINPDILKGFHFYSEGYYEVPFREDLIVDERQIKAPAGPSVSGSAFTASSPAAVNAWPVSRPSFPTKNLPVKRLSILCVRKK
jgi:hypothetical protein